jgi:hypothetical protein
VTEGTKRTNQPAHPKAARDWQLRKIAEGKCGICGKRPIVSGGRCKVCQTKNRVRSRNAYRERKKNENKD